MLLLVLLLFSGALLAPILSRVCGNRTGLILSLLPLAFFLVCLARLGDFDAGPVSEVYRLGTSSEYSLIFLQDGLSLLFILLVCYPDRPVIAMVGDGAMQMLGNLCLINIARFYSEWSDPRLIVLVLNNRDLNQVTWEQRIMAGDPKFSVSQDVPAFNYAEYGKLLGLEGIEVIRPEEIRPAYERALHAGRPVVIDAHCDPDVPPLPPHINFEQAKGYMSALFQGDPNEMGIINQSAKQMMSEYLMRWKG